MIIFARAQTIRVRLCIGPSHCIFGQVHKILQEDHARYFLRQAGAFWSMIMKKPDVFSREGLPTLVMDTDVQKTCKPAIDSKRQEGPLFEAVGLTIGDRLMVHEETVDCDGHACGIVQMLSQW